MSDQTSAALPPLFRLQEIDDFFASHPEGLVFVPNRRLAAKIRQAQDHQQLQAGAKRWQALAVFSVEDWLQEQWQRSMLAGHCEALRVLSTTEEQLLWLAVLREDSEHSGLLNTAATADSLQAANRVLNLWNYSHGSATLERQRGEFEAGLDQRLFLQWREAFYSKLFQLGAMTQADMLNRAIESLPRRPACMLLGFQDLTPMLQQLVEHFDCVVRSADKSPSPAVRVQRYNDDDAQLRALAAWLKQQLHDNPHQRIGIIDPLLSQRRQVIERELRAVLEPDYGEPASPRTVAAINFSAGIPLGEAPIIDAIFLALELLEHDMGIDTLERLLASVFLLDSNVETGARAVWFQSLIDLGRRRLSNAWLVEHLANWPGVEFTSALLQSLTAVRLLLHEPGFDWRGQHSARRWDRQLQTLLETVGWPGQRELDSIEYQQVRAWYSVLDQYSNMDDLLGPHCLGTAKAMLQRLASRTPFQAETADSAIQVLGVLEGAGLHFDQVWMLSQDDGVWPPKPSPSPFIPLNLQRREKMPHADAARELAFAESLQANYLARADSVVISYGALRDGVTTRPSPLLRGYPVEEMDATQTCTITAHIPFEQLVDDRVAAVDAGPLSGGASLLSHQSACPFRAFAVHRLQALAVEFPDIGLDARDRGISLHRALEVFWEHTSSLDELLALNETALSDRLDSAVGAGISSLQRRRPDVMGQRFTELERLRLHSLLEAWIELEKQRPPFVVDARERGLTAEVGGQWQLQLRMDRVDRLADGKELLIDYKSGRVNIGDWAGDRPKDPQLPLYLASRSDDGRSAAIAYAEVRRDNVALRGLGEDSHGIDGIVPHQRWKDKSTEEWAKEVAAWRERIDALVAEYTAGHAAVSPKNAASCQYCHLHSLCRIQSEYSQ